jgi:DNA polymerase elongation subunit (family B)
VFKNIFYETKKNKIHLWHQIKGKNFYDEIDWVPYVYIDDEEGEIKSIDGKQVSKKTFKTYNEYYVYTKENPNIKENILKPEIQFLAERYHQIADDEIENPNLKVYSIDIEVHSSLEEGFPKAEEAKAPVCLISIYDNTTNKTISFGLKEYTGKYKNTDWLTYIHCKNEETLLQQFFGFMHRYPCDVISGWNCVPLTNTIYKENEIVLLSDIQKGDVLSNNNLVDVVYPHSFKNINIIKLANGSVLKTSKDHIIPIRIIDNNKYTKLIKNDKCNNHITDLDMKVNDIPFKEKSCFVQIPFNLNKNEDMNIDNDLLYMAGLIYTDGSMRDKKQKNQGYRIYQSNIELLENIPYVTTSICGNRKKGYSRHIKHSVINDVYSFIYTDDGNKSLNLNLLSKLSKNQFYYFLSGLLDGDGCKSDVGMGLCDFTSDGIDKLYDLCLWNGVFVTRSKNRMRFIEYDLTKLHLKHPYRWKNIQYSGLTRCSSQMASKIKFKKVGQNYYVKINEIEETTDIVEMGDIKTSSGYFLSNGVKVHNCMSFDLQYLINRSMRIFGEDSKVHMKLSPMGNVRDWVTKEGDFNMDIAGVTILDYLDIYKWYSPTKLERYTLEYVSNHELGQGKVDYSKVADDLRELYDTDWNLYVEYNIIDAYRVHQIEEKCGYIKLIQNLSLLCKCPMKFYHTQTALIEAIFITYYRRNGLCAPTFYGGTQEGYPAAFVKDPITGLHNWIIDLDITSSYPSAIITLNMSNETYYGRILGFTEDQLMYHMKNRNIPEFDMMKDTGKVHFSDRKLNIFNEAIKKRLLCVAPCGSVFSTTTPGVISTVEKLMFYKRVEVKKKMKKMKGKLSDLKGKDLEKTKERIARYHGLQNALKIILNSTYGILAVPFSRYFNTNIAEAIVSCGRHTIRSGEKIVNDILNNPPDDLLEIIKEVTND